MQRITMCPSSGEKSLRNSGCMANANKLGLLDVRYVYIYIYIYIYKSTLVYFLVVLCAIYQLNKWS